MVFPFAEEVGEAIPWKSKPDADGPICPDVVFLYHYRRTGVRSAPRARGFGASGFVWPRAEGERVYRAHLRLAAKRSNLE
jgi:hypothetical protein